MYVYIHIYIYIYIYYTYYIIYIYKQTHTYIYIYIYNGRKAVYRVPPPAPTPAWLPSVRGRAEDHPENDTIKHITNMTI